MEGRKLENLLFREPLSSSSFLEIQKKKESSGPRDSKNPKKTKKHTQREITERREGFLQTTTTLSSSHHLQKPHTQDLVEREKETKEVSFGVVCGVCGNGCLTFEKQKEKTRERRERETKVEFGDQKQNQVI